MHALARFVVVVALFLSLVPRGEAALIGHWELNESSGAAADSVRGNNGTLFGGVTQGQAGIAGSAYAFDGVDDFIDILPGSNVVGGLAYPFTVSAWVKQSSLQAPVGSARDVAVFLGKADNSQYFEIGTNDGNAELVGRNTGVDGIAGPAVNDDVFHHVVGVFAAPNLRQLYVDGVLVGTDTSTVNLVTAMTRFSIGRLNRPTPADHFTGLIDDVGMWTEALSAGEIATIAANGQAGLSLQHHTTNVNTPGSFRSDFDGIDDDFGQRIGSAFIDTENNRLVITRQADNQIGSFYLPDLNPGKAIDTFKATFTLQQGPSTDANPADGLSFFFGEFPDVTTIRDENFNIGSGLKVLFDNEFGTPAEVIRVFFNDVEIGALPKTLTTSQLTDVSILVDAEGNFELKHGTDTLALQLAGWDPQVGWQFAFTGRTGGRDSLQFIDDLNITAAAIPEPASIAMLGLAGLALLRRRRVA